VSDKLTTSTEQPTAATETAQHGPSMGFFGVGIVINLLLIAAYFIWAFRQSKKTRDREE
jgi:heme/copper-type cytochrome/quinol oxidase subunit 2